VRSMEAFATTVVTRLCLDRLKSARMQREEYVGPWLPEPVVLPEAGPEAALQRRESVTLAFLVLLETLSPEERAVFLLKEVFEYGHDEVADMLGLTTNHSRQLLHRAKSRIAEGKPRVTPSASQRPIAERFAAAFSAGDAAEMQALLAQDVGFWSDGGGKVTAVSRPVFGRDTVTKLFLSFKRAAIAMGLESHAVLEVTEVNNEPAFVLRLDGALDGVFVLSIEDNKIAAIRVVRNPDKLTYLARQLGTEIHAPE